MNTTLSLSIFFFQISITTFFLASSGFLFRKIVMELEYKQPGTRHSLVNGMEKIRDDVPPPPNLSECPSCGEPSGGNGPCVFCREFGSFSV